jgi:hypothetical protein
MWVVVGVVAAVVLVATYVTWIASRVDRLHARATATFSALDAQSVRRAAAAAAMEPAEVQAAAKAVLGAHPDDREVAENDLTRALRTAAGDHDPNAVAAAVEPSRRLALARQVHADVVRDALAVRRRWLVRLLRLTRRHPEPAFFNIDDPTLDEPTAPAM